jgi:hypothetical protein
MVFLFVLFVCSVAGQIVNVTDATFPLSATLYPPNVQTRPSLSGLCDLAGGGNDLQLAATVDSLSLTYRFSLTGVTFVDCDDDVVRVGPGDARALQGAARRRQDRATRTRF